MSDKEKAVAHLLATGWTPHEGATNVYDHPSGAVYIDLNPDVDWQDGTIAAIYARHSEIPALLSPGYAPEVVRQVIEKTKTHFAGNPEYNSQEKACMRDALEMFYARLLRQPSTPPDTERGDKA